MASKRTFKLELTEAELALAFEAFEVMRESCKDSADELDPTDGVETAKEHASMRKATREYNALMQKVGKLGGKTEQPKFEVVVLETRRVEVAYGVIGAKTADEAEEMWLDGECDTVERIVEERDSDVDQVLEVQAVQS